MVYFYGCIGEVIYSQMIDEISLDVEINRRSHDSLSVIP